MRSYAACTTSSGAPGRSLAAPPCACGRQRCGGRLKPETHPPYPLYTRSPHPNPSLTRKDAAGGCGAERARPYSDLAQSTVPEAGDPEPEPEPGRGLSLSLILSQGLSLSQSPSQRSGNIQAQRQTEQAQWQAEPLVTEEGAGVEVEDATGGAV